MLLKKKIIGRSRFYDVAHKGWVNVCLLASALTLGTALYSYIFLNKALFTRKKVESTNKEADIDLASTINEKQGEIL